MIARVCGHVTTGSRDRVNLCVDTRLPDHVTTWNCVWVCVDTWLQDHVTAGPRDHLSLCVCVWTRDCLTT